MSLKTLFSTTTTTLTSGLIGIAKAGNVIGSTTEWMSEWADSLNSDKAKSIREQERDWELKQRALELVRQKNELDTSAIKEAVSHSKQVDEILSELL